jgi:uncharacterized protein
MKIPFIYGKLVADFSFTNREQETQLLKSQFLSSMNCILVSPRRWGKSSLIKHAAKLCQQENPNVKIVFIDLFKINDEHEFYEILATEIIKAGTDKSDQILQKISTFFKNIIPKISFSPIPESEFSLSLDWENLNKNKGEILDLAQTIAEKENLKFVICIDEFQDIEKFEGATALYKKLRSHWQQHNLVSYCLYGSKEQMMQNIFTKASMPFYHFGSILFLDKIREEKWVSFIEEKFKITNKKITKEAIDCIIELSDNIPYYVQQLCHYVWIRSLKKAEIEQVKEAHRDLLNTYSYVFMNTIETLSALQINLLKAIVNQEPILSSIETLNKYKLGTSGNVVKAKKALLSKQILRTNNGTFSFLDPIFRFWFKEYFMKKG